MFIARVVVYPMSTMAGELDEISTILGEASSEINAVEALKNLAEEVGVASTQAQT